MQAFIEAVRRYTLSFDHRPPALARVPSVGG